MERVENKRRRRRFIGSRLSGETWRKLKIKQFVQFEELIIHFWLKSICFCRISRCCWHSNLQFCRCRIYQAVNSRNIFDYLIQISKCFPIMIQFPLSTVEVASSSIFSNAPLESQLITANFSMSKSFLHFEILRLDNLKPKNCWRELFLSSNELLQLELELIIPMTASNLIEENSSFCWLENLIH